MNDNGADSFKSTQGLFKAQLTRLREPFMGQELQSCRQGEPACCREIKSCRPSTFPNSPLPVKTQCYDTAQRSRRACKAKEALKRQRSSPRHEHLVEIPPLVRASCLHRRAFVQQGSSNDVETAGAHPYWMGG